MKIVIAGGPYSGKTTLVNALRDEGFATFPEAALMVIAKEQANGNMSPWDDRAKFQRDIFDIQLQQVTSVVQGVTIFDRGLPDGLAYYYLDGLTPPEEIVQTAREHRYDIIFITELLGPYVPGVIRGESEVRRKKIQELIIKAYYDAGYEPVLIPEASVPERVLFVKSVIESVK